MSRTTRAIPHHAHAYRVDHALKALLGDASQWGARYIERFGRDGVHRSNCYAPYKWAPNFIDRWREDGVDDPRLKREAKRALAQMRRRHDKRIIRALLLGDDA